MKATKEYIQKKFDEYNRLCFDGKLEPLPIQLSRARTFLGQVAYMRKRKWNGFWHYYNFVFKISVLLDLPEQEVEDTILHEMIHYYILSNQIQDTSAHGVVFRQMMQDINQRFHRNLTITHKRSKEELEQDRQVRQHLICVVRFKNGQTGITIAAKTRLYRLWNALPKVPEVESCRWYVSTDSYFNRFPRALSLKVYKVPQEELKLHLQDALSLVKTGNVIQVQK